MAEIYVPINYSNVKDVIPVGEDIIYSTLCRATKGEPGSLKFWRTHLLITNKGIAFSKPGEKKRDPPELIYLNWTRVIYVLKKGLRLDLFKPYPASKFECEFLDLTLKFDPTFESKDKFKKRLKEFPRKFIPFMLEKKNTFLQSQDSSFLAGSQRRLLESFIEKMTKYYNKRF